LRCECSPFPFPAHARAHNEIRAAGRDRVDKRRHLLRTIAVVAVEKDNDVGPAKRSDAGLAGGTVAALVLDNDASASRTRRGCRAIVRAVVGDDNVIDPRRYIADDVSDRLLLVKGGDDDAYAFAVTHLFLFLCWPPIAPLAQRLEDKRGPDRNPDDPNDILFEHLRFTHSGKVKVHIVERNRDC